MTGTTSGSFYQKNLANASTIGADSNGVFVSGGAAGNVNGPGSSTNNGIATWNGTGGTALFSRASPLVSSTGVMTNSNQPAFLVNLSNGGGASNCTGDGTSFQVPYDTVVFDQGSNFTTGSSAHFTAPVTGRYHFDVGLNLFPAATTGLAVIVNIVATSRSVTIFNQTFLVGQFAVSSQFVPTGSCIIDMTAADTLQVNLISSGGTKTMTLFGSANTVTWLSGYLVA